MQIILVGVIILTAVAFLAWRGISNYRKKGGICSSDCSCCSMECQGKKLN